MLVDEIAGGFAGAEDEPQPAASLASGADLAATDEIPLGDDADKLADVVNHGEAADVPLQHDVCRLDDAGVGGNRDDRAGHDLVGAHGEAPQVHTNIDVWSLGHRQEADLTQVKQGWSAPNPRAPH